MWCSVSIFSNLSRNRRLFFLHWFSSSHSWEFSARIISELEISSHQRSQSSIFNLSRNRRRSALASYLRSTTQRGHRLRPRRVWRSIRLLRIYSVNCVFLTLWRKIRAFYYLSRENFHLWADRQKMNVVLSQKRVISFRSNFLRFLQSWTRPTEKKLGKIE